MLWRTAPDWFRVVLYLLMGWLVVVALGPLRAVLPPMRSGWWSGAASLTLGTVVFAADRPHLWPGRFSAHDLWHLFVLGGSACYYVLMARYIAPAVG